MAHQIQHCGLCNSLYHFATNCPYNSDNLRPVSNIDNAGQGESWLARLPGSQQEITNGPEMMHRSTQYNSRSTRSRKRCPNCRGPHYHRHCPLFGEDDSGFDVQDDFGCDTGSANDTEFQGNISSVRVAAATGQHSARDMCHEGSLSLEDAASNSSTHYSNRFPRSNPARHIVCYHCGISGHVWANCNRLRSHRINRGRGNGRQNNTIQCFHGSGPHYRRNCPQVARTAPHNRQPANNNNTSNTQRRVEFQSTDGGASGGQNNRSADQNRYLEDVRATHRLNNTSIRSVRNEFHSPAPTALEEQDNDSW
jgi:hypothetical protein